MPPSCYEMVEEGKEQIRYHVLFWRFPLTVNSSIPVTYVSEVPFSLLPLWDLVCRGMDCNIPPQALVILPKSSIRTGSEGGFTPMGK